MSDRLVQAAAALLAAAAFSGAAFLSPALDRQRRECRMVYEPSGGGDKDATYRLVENLGALRGIAVNALWGQLTEQKNAGRFHEADALGRRIAELQPRMPEVWRYLAYNMAYNISVKCQTQEERWAWIRKAIRLLEEEGIPNNPGSQPLYRELAWIYQHKVAGENDDMNRWYKKRMAEDWQSLLGAPPVGRQPREGGAPGETEDIATARMRRIARAAGEAYPVLPGGGRATSVAPAAKAAFLAAHPDAAHAVAQMDAACRAAGLAEPGFSPALGAAVGRVLAYGEYLQMAGRAGLSDLSRRLEDRIGAEGRAVLAVLRRDARAREGVDQALPWLQAMAIVEREHMDPVEMLAAMERFGPLDWRHPQSHALYWAWLGSRRAENPDPYTKLNSDRIILAGAQGLMQAGRLFYDPVEDSLSDQPDPRFIAAYDEAQQFLRRRAAAHEYGNEVGVGGSLDRGEENFLHAAIQVSFLFGDEAQAQAYYRRVKERFPASPVYSRYYRMSLPDFVTVTIREDQLRVVQGSAMTGLLTLSLEAALLEHDPGRAETLFRMAESVREKVERDRAEAVKAAAGSGEGRQPVPTLDQLQQEALVRFMTDPGHTLRQRATVWAQLPQQARLALFDLVERMVYPQVKASGLPVPPEKYFPPPEGLAEFRKQRAGQGPVGPLAPDRK